MINDMRFRSGKLLLPLVAYAITLPMTSASLGVELFVSASSSGTTGTTLGTKENPFRTIDAAVRQLGDVGGTIFVEAGVYSGPIELPRGVTVKGGYDRTFTRQTLIDRRTMQSEGELADDYARATVLVNPSQGEIQSGDRVLTVRAQGGKWSYRTWW